MGNCVLCFKELKFMNTPTFGSGKLRDGEEVCLNCFKKINKINRRIAFKLKNHSLEEIKSLILGQETNLQSMDIPSNIGYQSTYHWYDKTWLVILLCILFFPVGLYALWKSTTISIRGKIISTVIIGIIFIAALIDNDKKEKDSEKKETTPIVSSEKPVAVTPTLTTEEQTTQKLKEQLKREIASFEKPFDGSSYRNTVANLQMEIVLFSVWATIINEGQNSSDDENKKLSDELKRKVSVRQINEFPKIRQSYGELVGTKLWENNIYVSTQGQSKSIINLSGGLFANNKNIAETQQTLLGILTQFRFKEIRYRWYKEADEFTYYKLETPKDNEIIENIK